jgi:hypothetical protein
MTVAQQQGERWSSQNILLEGGLYLDKDVLYQASQMPGSAIDLVNMEPSLDGGYHRILGYQPFDTNQMPHGASTVWGVVVNPFESTITAMQGGDTYQSDGAGWSKISGVDNHPHMGIVQHTNYTWATSRFAWVDGDPAAHPVRVEANGVYTVLTNAPTGQKFIQEFSGYLWMSDGTGSLTFSAPNDDTNYNAISGAGELTAGFNIVGIGVWRGALYVFGNQRIAQVTGTSAADWVITLLTDEIGMTGTYSLQEVNGDLVFLSSDGLRTISGTARIFDRELGVISRPITTLIVPLGNANLISTTIRTKSQYRLFQGTSSTSPSTALGILGTLKLQTNGSVAWEWSKTQGMLISSADDGLFNGMELTIHGGFDGYVYQQESGTSFNGSPIAALYQTPYLIFNDPLIRKIPQKLCANFRTDGNVTISIGVLYDYADPTVSNPGDNVIQISGGSGLWDSGLTWDNGTLFWDSYPLTRKCAYITGSGFSCSFLFSSSGGPDYSLQAYTVQFAQGARR